VVRRRKPAGFISRLGRIEGLEKLVNERTTEAVKAKQRADGEPVSQFHSRSNQ
jgi:hypothetical protein